jgi:RNA polymerase sigma factor (sigma-70 family)
MDQSADSISEWLGQLKAGQIDAAQKLWDRYSAELLGVAKQRLGNCPCGAADKEDVALSVFGSIFRGAAEGRFGQISTRDELCWLLLSITKRKAVDYIRRETAQKRHGEFGQTGQRRAVGDRESCLFSLDDLISSEPTPDFLIALEEQYVRLLARLRNDQLREIVVLRIDGYTVREIAQKINIGSRAVERKLQLIRAKWTRELLASDRT